MAEFDDIQTGHFYWCDTARSNLASLFSEKARRPVLVVAKIGGYAALYPCSSDRGDLGASEWVGNLFGNGDTHLIYGCGLFYAPLSDLESPAVVWADWKSWSRHYRQHIHADLEHLRQRHQHRLETPMAGRSHKPQKPLTTSLSDFLSPELLKRFEEPPPPPPTKPKPAPPRPKPRLSPAEEFRRAIENLPPYLMFKEDDED